MSFWKVLGGVAAGIGVMVALPVLAPVGAITAVGAAIGAAAGGTAGAIASSKGKNEKSEAYSNGYEKGKAECALNLEHMQRNLARAADRMREYRKFEDFIIALSAVAISVANCDGFMDEKERDAISHYISGLSTTKLPTETRELIEMLYHNPPSFNTAMEYVKKIDRSEWDIIGDVIELVMWADGEVKQSESDYLSAWNKYKAS